MICRNHVDVSEGVRRCSRCGATFCRNCLVDIQGAPYCATCKTETILDVRSGVERITLQYASVWKRWGAIIIDGLITTAPLYAVFIAFVMYQAFQGKQPHWLMNFVGIPMLFVTMIYEGLMFQHKNGQTLGKMALKIRVVRADGSPISPGQAWGRAGLKVVFACLSIFDYLPAFFTDERTTLHDMAAKTRVVEV
jgi:uncharacterized RDD family membrane protein YckC